MTSKVLKRYEVQIQGQRKSTIDGLSCTLNQSFDLTALLSYEKKRQVTFLENVSSDYQKIVILHIHAYYENSEIETVATLAYSDDCVTLTRNKKDAVTFARTQTLRSNVKAEKALRTAKKNIVDAQRDFRFDLTSYLFDVLEACEITASKQASKSKTALEKELSEKEKALQAMQAKLEAMQAQLNAQLQASKQASK